MQKRLLVLNVVACALVTVAWVLAASAVALGEWTNTRGGTVASSTVFGGVTIDQRSGLYQTITRTCCTVSNQLVPELGSGKVCNTAAACETTTYTTANYCDLVDDLLKKVNRGKDNISCRSVQGGAVITILLTLIVILSVLAAVALFLLKKIKCGTFMLALLPGVLSSMFSTILYKVLVKDQIQPFMRGRYGSQEFSLNPFTTVLGDSYSLLIASFVIFLFGWTAAVIRFVLRPKKLKPVPKPKPREPIYEEPVEEEDPEMMTPHRTEVNNNNNITAADKNKAEEVYPYPYVEETQTKSSAALNGSRTRGGIITGSSSSPPARTQSKVPQRHPSDPVPVCPNDMDCPFYDKFGHQLEYRHTCRNLNCTDSSMGHNQHFVHTHQSHRALSRTSPSRRDVPTSRPPAVNGGAAGSPLRKQPSWLRPTRDGLQPLGEEQPSRSPDRTRSFTSGRW